VKEVDPSFNSETKPPGVPPEVSFWEKKSFFDSVRLRIDESNPQK